MNGSILSLLAIAVLIGAGSRWLLLMQRVQIPADVRPYLVATALAALFGIGALMAGVGAIGGVAAVVAIVGGAAFLALYSASGQARLEPAVRLGGPVLEFTTGDDEGRAFDLAELRGSPFLLKFFRGHWCPYCVAELRRWEEMRPVLDAHGIQIVTICSDDAEAVRKGRHKHGLRAVMLPDPNLALTDLYHLRNPKNFAPKPGIIIPLPIPTTILVDAAGTVRWIDQATDYMHRSDPERVLAAIRANLPLPGGDHADHVDGAKTALPLWSNGDDAKADVVVASLGLESQAEGGSARPTIVAPAATTTGPRDVAELAPGGGVSRIV